MTAHTVNVPRMRRYTGWQAKAREIPKPCPECGRIGSCSSCCCNGPAHRRGIRCDICRHEGSHR
jgi:hypothetical protein